jgi:hypothetical protein
MASKILANRSNPNHYRLYLKMGYMICSRIASIIRRSSLASPNKENSYDLFFEVPCLLQQVAQVDVSII